MNLKDLDYIQISSFDINKEFVAKVKKNGVLSVDVETTGLDWRTNKLSTVQLYSSGLAYIYQNKQNTIPKNIVKLLQDKSVNKVFHHAMFDMKFLIINWKVDLKNVSCTKVASKILQPGVKRHKLKSLLGEYVDVDIKKDMYDSNWEKDNLSQDQIRYALNDVIYLQSLMNKLDKNLKKYNLDEVAQACFDFLPFNAWLEVNEYEDIFGY